VPNGRGPEIDPSLPGYAWVARIVKAVEDRTGTTTRWNGRLYQELDQEYAGSADDDGSLTVGERDVMTPAEYAHTHRDLNHDDVRNAVDAAATVCHEARHFSSALDDPGKPGAHPTRDAPGTALDEGLVERWTHANIGAVIRTIRMDRDVPGAAQQRPKDAYPAYTSATKGLVRGLATSTGRDAFDLEQRLLVCEGSQRWNLMADMAIDHHLSELMPDGDQEAVRARLANALRADFGHAREIHVSDVGEHVKRQQGTEVGTRAIGNLNRDIEELADEYRDARQANDLTAARGQGQGQRQGQAAAAGETARLRNVFAGQSPAARAAVAPGQAPGATSRRVSPAGSPGRDGPRRS
jgi:hypothetical protein